MAREVKQKAVRNQSFFGEQPSPFNRALPPIAGASRKRTSLPLERLARRCARSRGNMISKKQLWLAGFAGGALLPGVTAGTMAHARAFAIREQSAYFQGSAFAGDAAGVDISSMFWNPAAAAALSGLNDSENLTGIFARTKETATSGLFVTGAPAVPGVSPAIPGLPNTADVGANNLVPASYTTYQVNDRLWIGVALNSPFGFTTKPDHFWAGSVGAVTAKAFSFDANPTIAYKIAPNLTLGAGLQVEYGEFRFTRDGYGQIFPSRSLKVDDWGVGATAGVIWEPFPGTAVGVGYRSAVSLDLNGPYNLGPSQSLPAGLLTSASVKVTTPDEVTFSVRHAINPQWTALATVEWGIIGATSKISCLHLLPSAPWKIGPEIPRWLVFLGGRRIRL